MSTSADGTAGGGLEREAARHGNVVLDSRAVGMCPKPGAA
jgi:hypothetical protein